MRIGKCSWTAMFVTLLTLNGVAAARPNPLRPVEPPPPEVIAKLVAQLGAADARSRQEASDKLEELGGPVLPVLRKAIAASADKEAQRRMEDVATRIENVLLKTEEGRWQDLDAPRRGVKDRLVKILARTPALSDRQAASAIYLLSVGRPPTDDEVKKFQKQLVETNGRAASLLAVARSLVQSADFSAAVADVNVRLAEVAKELAAEKDLATTLARVNSPGFQKLADDSAAAIDPTATTDGQLVDLAFLLALSRFPKTNESDAIVAHLKKAGRRSAISDILWSLMNSKEFLLPR
jgi:hypothetical protein